MAEKIVKVCDRCKVELELFNTANWETATFNKLALGNPQGESVKYDLCRTCATAVKVYIIEFAALEAAEKGERDG